MIGLYAVVNKHTRKAYIGSSVDVARRLIQHKSAIKTCNFLHYQPYAQDAKAYGVESFSFVPLKETQTIEEARELETAFLQIFLDDLYNVAPSALGGAGETRENTAPYIAGAAKRLADPEFRTRLSAACKGKRAIVTCPHCNLEGGGGNMRRYHFDKCRSKK